MLLTNRSRIHYFICDVTVASFYMRLKPNFNTTSTIYAGMRIPSITVLLLHVAKILAGGAEAQRLQKFSINRDTY